MQGKGWIAAAVFLADRITKLFAERFLRSAVTLIPGVLGLRPARNTGMAFSLLSGHPLLLGILSLGILTGAFLALRKKKLDSVSQTGLMMMLGGAAGNLADRLLSGYVPDMIEFLFIRFAVFNVADTCLVTGCGLVIWNLFRGKENG
ncbi:MAG: signal peptidase II [Clostridia bacterium]|nr:signal peptidase II [Clostridia bacterium]